MFVRCTMSFTPESSESCLECGEKIDEEYDRKLGLRDTQTQRKRMWIIFFT